MLLTDRDKKIIEIIKQENKVSLSKIGEKLGISHVAVKKHLEKLFKKRILRIEPTINLKKMSIRIALIQAEVGSIEEINEIFMHFKDCPRMIFMAQAIGQYNIVAMMYAEDLETLNSILNYCAFRNFPKIRKSDVLIIPDIFIPEFWPFNISITKNRRKAPCGTICSKCNKYLNNKCLGCPATVYYRQK